MSPALLRNEHGINMVEMKSLLVCLLARDKVFFISEEETVSALYVTPGSKNATSTVQTPGSNFLLSPYSKLSSSSRCVRIPKII